MNALAVLHFIEFLFVLGFVVGLLSAAIFFYGVLRFWFIKNTKRNVILAFIFGPFALGVFDVEEAKKMEFVRTLKLAGITLIVAFLILLSGVFAAYMV